VIVFSAFAIISNTRNTKTINLRVNKLLSSTISKEQFGFLHGRQVQDAIGVA
jgi:hypothetical protein